jgi:hypothetical protein
MTSGGTAQGNTGPRAGTAVCELELGFWAWRIEVQALASIAQRGTAEQLPMAVGYSALGANMGSEAEPDPSSVQDAPSGLVLLRLQQTSFLRISTSAAAASTAATLYPCLPCSKNGAAGGRPRRLATAARRWPVARDRSPAWFGTCSEGFLCAPATRAIFLPQDFHISLSFST